MKCFQRRSSQRRRIYSSVSNVSDLSSLVTGIRQEPHMFQGQKARPSSRQPQLLSEIVLRNNVTSTRSDSRSDSLCAYIYERFPHQ